MPAIKAVNSKNIKVINCKFSGFDTDVELENVEGFISKNNSFSQDNNPRILISQLIASIRESRLDNSSKERLYKEIFSFLSNSSKRSNADVNTLKEKIIMLLGNKAADYFIQLAAAVSAGLVLRFIK